MKITSFASTKVIYDPLSASKMLETYQAKHLTANPQTMRVFGPMHPKSMESSGLMSVEDGMASSMLARKTRSALSLNIEIPVGTIPIDGIYKGMHGNLGDDLVHPAPDSGHKKRPFLERSEVCPFG